MHSIWVFTEYLPEGTVGALVDTAHRLKANDLSKSHRHILNIVEDNFHIDFNDFTSTMRDVPADSSAVVMPEAEGEALLRAVSGLMYSVRQAVKDANELYVDPAVQVCAGKFSMPTRPVLHV